jgi:hypothetical protein
VEEDERALGLALRRTNAVCQLLHERA